MNIITSETNKNLVLLSGKIFLWISNKMRINNEYIFHIGNEQSISGFLLSDVTF